MECIAFRTKSAQANGAKIELLVNMAEVSGLRVSEISHLKITDIDSKNMRIKVVQGKGAKDRYTLLS